jgi:cell wall-associated NlpC family hydrolase
MTMEQMVTSIQQIQSTLSSLARGVPPTPTGASSAGFDQIVAAMTPSVSTVTSMSTPTSTSTSTSTAQATSAAASAATTASASTSAATGTAGGSVTGAEIVADAKKYIGVPYVLDGESTSGMDCSGLVQKVYKDEGVNLPRQVHTQKLEGTAVPSLAQAQPGDLIVFKGGGHIAIYAGNDTVIHAPYPGRTVSEQKLWVGDSGIETIRRIVPTTSAASTSNLLKPAAPKPVAAAPIASAPIASTPTSQAPAIGTVDAFLSSMSNDISTNSVAEFLAGQEAQMEQSQL